MSMCFYAVSQEPLLFISLLIYDIFQKDDTMSIKVNLPCDPLLTNTNIQHIVYSQTYVKHHPNIISETFFVYEFLQKNNQFN